MAELYTGSMSRYFSEDWEIGIVQEFQQVLGEQYGALSISSNPTPTSVDEVVAWRDRLAQAFGERLQQPLDWPEENAPWFAHTLDLDKVVCLLLWGAYDEQPQLARPTECVDLDDDPAYLASTEPDSVSRYRHLLSDIDWWLPARFGDCVVASDVHGDEAGFGSGANLLDQLNDLNRRTWQADDDAIERWLDRTCAHDCTPLEAAARGGFAALIDIGRKAFEHSLPMTLEVSE